RAGGLFPLAPHAIVAAPHGEQDASLGRGEVRVDELLPVLVGHRVSEDRVEITAGGNRVGDVTGRADGDDVLFVAVADGVEGERLEVGDLGDLGVKLGQGHVGG